MAYHVPKVFSGVIRITPAKICFCGETLVIGGMLESDIRGESISETWSTYVFAIGCCQY